MEGVTHSAREVDAEGEGEGDGDGVGDGAPQSGPVIVGSLGPGRLRFGLG